MSLQWTWLHAVPLLTGLLLSSTAAPDETTISLDFSKDKLPEGWTVSSRSWKVKDGMLRGEGDGSLEFAGPLGPDFTLTFQGWSAEKANFEVKLFDSRDNHELYTFAFLGRWHSALDGVKCCILREDRFVNVSSKMWIYPGRTFNFEVRVKNGQMQMFLDRELGPFFVDPAPLAPGKGVKLRILAATEGAKDEVRLDIFLRQDAAF
jgi:hypothetical protein